VFCTVPQAPGGTENRKFSVVPTHGLDCHSLRFDPLLRGQTEWFEGGQTVRPLWGRSVKKLKCFWVILLQCQIVQVEVSQYPNGLWPNRQDTTLLLLHSCPSGKPVYSVFDQSVNFLTLLCTVSRSENLAVYGGCECMNIYDISFLRLCSNYFSECFDNFFCGALVLYESRLLFPGQQRRNLTCFSVHSCACEWGITV
jgi:hypothetical protein